MASKKPSKLEQAAGENVKGFLSSAEQEQTSTEPEHEQDAPQAPRQPKTAPKTEKANISPQEEEKPENEPQKKPKRAQLGFRAEEDRINAWKAYATATRQEIGVLCAKAIDDYISRNPIEGVEQMKLYEDTIQYLQAKRAFNS